MSFQYKYLKYKNKYLNSKNQYGGHILKIDSHDYNINEEYYISGRIGKNPNNYPTLSSFSDANIDTKTGLSEKYPSYNFKFELFKSHNFDSGLADIYKLIITKINEDHILKIGSHDYNINEEYYIVESIGKNPNNYPTLSSFSDANIDTKTGLSEKYPSYNFKFELFKSHNFDSGLADIYKLIITKINEDHILKIGSHDYNINEEYYIVENIGKNPNNYPTLSCFNDANIDTKTGLSEKYPSYNFKFELFKSHNFDSGLASIYKLIITKNKMK
jgi:hypothetical protein